MSKRILLLGASGLLGGYLRSSLSDRGLIVATLGRAANSTFVVPEISDKALISTFKSFNPEIVINAIGETGVDKCEKFPEFAVHANVNIPIHLSSAINNLTGRKPHLIHISTDQVYGGLGLHMEKNVCPLNIYGWSKYSGELALSQIESCTILRTNFVGRSMLEDRVSLSDWIVSSLRNSEPITVFDDILFNPLYIGDLTDMIYVVISKKIPGVFNLGSVNSMSKAVFAAKLAEALGANQKFLNIGSVEDLKFDAKRPKDMRMDVRKFSDTFSIGLPTLESAVKAIANQYLRS